MKKHTVDGEYILDKIDNQWIVPYNPQLLLTFDCHLNVQYCGTISAVKYLYKYMYKGSDRANIKLKNKDDEITNYIDGRYYTQHEAHWNIAKLKMGGQGDISVTRLPYHLENKQPVRFKKEDKQLKTTVHETKFLEWFKTNAYEKSLVEKLQHLQENNAPEEEIKAVQDKLPKKQDDHDKYAFELLYQVTSK